MKGVLKCFCVVNCNITVIGGIIEKIKVWLTVDCCHDCDIPPQPSHTYCHDRDRTHPYSPYSDLSTPSPSHQNHPQAPNAIPEPAGSIPSQLVLSNALPNPLTPLRLNNVHLTRPDTPSTFCILALSQFLTPTLIPNPTPFDLLSSCIKSIPDVSLVS